MEDCDCRFGEERLLPRHIEVVERDERFYGMINEKNEFVIMDSRKKREFLKLKNLDGFFRAVDSSWYPLRECLTYHMLNGDLDRWYVSIGEGEFSRFMSRFKDSDFSTYVYAASIYWKNKRQPKPSFRNVMGYDKVKKTLLELVTSPEKYEKLAKRYGKEGGNGACLLYGPPGCGKTYMACALAGETSRFFSRMSMYKLMDYGLGDMFEVGRKVGGLVLLIDEMEALGVNRDSEGISSRLLANMLLTELDRLDGGLFFIGSTNSPWVLDPAILRSGRLDNLIYVGVPNREERLSLLMHYSRGLPLQPGLDFGKIADATEFYSCSDMKAVCKEAAAIPYREAMAGEKEREISQQDYEEAVKRIHSTALPWFESVSGIVIPSSLEWRFQPMLDEIERFEAWKGGPKANSSEVRSSKESMYR